MHGVLIIDKPVGPTSHDIVAGLRKLLGTRAIGHAGTLDPAASGVLVIAVGQGTKLVPYLTAQLKSYEATVALGTSTTTLDREGEIVASGPVPPELAVELLQLGLAPPTGPTVAADSVLGRALANEMNRREQVPPAFSAIKQNGRAAHKLARRGEVVVLPPRPVELRSVEILGATADSVRVRLEVSKGYYVRSFARDLGECLNVPAHLAALRRLASGAFTLAEAVLPSAPRDSMIAAMQSITEAARRVLPVAQLSAEGARCARFGQVLTPSHFVSHPPAADGPSAWLDPEGELLAIGSATEPEKFAVDRGFPHSTSSDAI